MQDNFPDSNLTKCNLIKIQQASQSNNLFQTMIWLLGIIYSFCNFEFISSEKVMRVNWQKINEKLQSPLQIEKYFSILNKKK